MSAIEAGISAYRPAQLLNWVHMSLQDSQKGAFDAPRAELDTLHLDANISKRSAADLSSNYLNNFFHLKSEVQFLSVIHTQNNYFKKAEGVHIYTDLTTGYLCCKYNKPHMGHTMVSGYVGAYEYVFCAQVYSLSVFSLFWGASADGMAGIEKALVDLTHPCSA